MPKTIPIGIVKEVAPNYYKIYTLLQEKVADSPGARDMWLSFEHHELVEGALFEMLDSMNNKPVTMEHAANLLVHLVLFALVEGKRIGRGEAMMERFAVAEDG